MFKVLSHCHSHSHDSGKRTLDRTRSHRTLCRANISRAAEAIDGDVDVANVDADDDEDDDDEGTCNLLPFALERGSSETPHDSSKGDGRKAVLEWMLCSVSCEYTRACSACSALEVSEERDKDDEKEEEDDDEDNSDVVLRPNARVKIKCRRSDRYVSRSVVIYWQ